MRIDFVHLSGEKPQLQIDGKPADDHTVVTLTMLLNGPTGVWVNGERVSDVKVYLYGTMAGRVPPHMAEEDWERLEASNTMTTKGEARAT